MNKSHSKELPKRYNSELGSAQLRLNWQASTHASTNKAALTKTNILQGSNKSINSDLIGRMLVNRKMNASAFMQDSVEEIEKAAMQRMRRKKMVLATSKPSPIKASHDDSTGLVAKERGNIVQSPSMIAYRTQAWGGGASSQHSIV